MGKRIDRKESRKKEGGKEKERECQGNCGEKRLAEFPFTCLKCQTKWSEIGKSGIPRKVTFD